MAIRPENVYLFSLFVQRECERHPELLTFDYEQVYQDGELIRFCREAVLQSVDEKDLKKILRQWRREQMVRIATRDLSGAADLTETMRDISELAEGLVSGTLDWWYPRLCEKWGVPIGEESGQAQNMIVVAMGKLGGYELNFSSDIDLIFAYPEKGQTDSERPISNDQFFIKLGQIINKSLTEMTPDGIVYRVDMRLRPFGEAGPLAISFTGAEHYYEMHGRAWERYALVKARAVAGDKSKAQELANILRPFIYRRYIDYTAIDSLRDLKRMISAQVRKKGMQANIKLGTGGIREVEFIVQAFQLVHGGRDKTLQGRSLLPMLRYLAQENYLNSQDAERLELAYVFLRRVENRLQQWNDQQTHDLPTEENQQTALAHAMNYDSYTDFIMDLETHRALVQQHFDDVFAEEADVCDLTETLAETWKGALEDDALIVLMQFGFQRPGEILNLLRQFKKTRVVGQMSAEASNRLDQVIPLLLKQLADLPNDQEIALARVLGVIESVVRRSVYLVLLKENPVALQHLIKLCSISPWLTDMLVKYPALMDQLLDLRSLYRPLKLAELIEEAQDLLKTYAEDEEEFMLQLRHWRHAQVFKVAAADITGHVPVMHVSDYLTWIAEAVLRVAHDYAWKKLSDRYGKPQGQSESSFAILGYGKLGGIELGYGSDLDLVFIYDLTTETDMENQDEKPIEAGVFFTRMGQKIISLLTTMMPAGQLYEVDIRLRPNGSSGLMVTALESFKQYQREKAWNWEHQALIRTRCVVGSSEIHQKFEQFRQTFLTQAREADTVKNEVVEMRQKMRESLDQSNEHEFDLKHGIGGIVDIEFMVQYLVLAFAHQQPGLVVNTDNMRILDVLKETDLLDAESIKNMQDHYRAYRSAYHRLALQKEKAIVSGSQFKAERQQIAEIWKKLMIEAIK